MTITRWTPLREFVSLRDAMDKLFEESFIPPTLLGMDHKLFFPVDLYEKPEAFTLKAHVPGIDPEKIVVEATITTVLIKGEKKEEKEEKYGTAVRKELRYGEFERIIELPMEIDPAKVEAKYEKGVLVLTLPKSEFVKPKTVKINIL